MKKKRSDKVTVRIRATEIVSYERTVEMSAEEWKELKNFKPIGRIETSDVWLGLEHIDDGQGIDEDDLEMFVVGKDGKPVKPADQWEPR